MKTHASEPSLAIRNARETAETLIYVYKGKEGKDNVPPFLTVSTDERPKIVQIIQVCRLR